MNRHPTLSFNRNRLSVSMEFDTQPKSYTHTYIERARFIKIYDYFDCVCFDATYSVQNQNVLSPKKNDVQCIGLPERKSSFLIKLNVR